MSILSGFLWNTCIHLRIRAQGDITTIVLTYTKYIVRDMHSGKDTYRRVNFFLFKRPCFQNNRNIRGLRIAYEITASIVLLS